MAKRDGGSKASGTADTTRQSSGAATSDAMEQRVIAFAEQLGRIYGTVQAKTEGWMDREALSQQIASVRDGAAELLEQLSDGVTNLTGTAPKAARSAAPAAKSKGRSGGMVDAPGKKHRKPAPKDARAIAAKAKASTQRAASSSMKTMKKRGRG